MFFCRKDFYELPKGKEKTILGFNRVQFLGLILLAEYVEAEVRLERVLEMMQRPEINYISGKLSSVVSQIITIDARNKS